MRSNYSIDDEVSREQIDIKLKSLTNTLQELKKGINIDDSPRFHEDSDYKSMSNTLYSDIHHSNLNTKVNLSEYLPSINHQYNDYINSADKKQSNDSTQLKDEYSADYKDLKTKSSVELIQIIQSEKNRNREAHTQLKDYEFENTALNKRITELNKEVNDLDKLCNQQNHEQMSVLVNRLNESEKEMSRCHGNLIEQDDIIKRLQNEDNNLRDQLRKTENELNELKNAKNRDINDKNNNKISDMSENNFKSELQKLKKAQDNLLNEFDNKNQIMAELKQSEIDNVDIIQNLSNELENAKNILKRNEDRMNSKDEEIMHQKKIVIEMNSNQNSKDNSFVNLNNINQVNTNEDRNNLLREISERDHKIQKLSDEINMMKNKNGSFTGGKTFSTPKTSRINYDPMISRSQNNRKVSSIPPKSERNENKQNPVLSSTREMIKKDKMKSDFNKKEDLTTEDVNILNFLYESLCRIFNTKIHSEIINKAENLQNQVDLNSDQVKFYHKTRDLLQASIPQDLTRRDDGSVRMIFKLIVKIVDNYADMKKSIKVLKQQVEVVETINVKDAQLADHFSSLLEVNNKSHQSIIEDMKYTIEKQKVSHEHKVNY